MAVGPACPGPGYTWVEGYFARNGVWIAGYWAPPAVVLENVRVHDRDHDFSGRDVYFDRDHGRR